MEFMNEQPFQELNENDGNLSQNPESQEEPKSSLGEIATSFGRRIESSVRRTVRDNLKALEDRFADDEIRQATEAAKKMAARAEDGVNRAWAFIEKNAPAGKSRTTLLPGTAEDSQAIAESIMEHWRVARYGVQRMRFEHDGIPATLIQIRNAETAVGSFLRKAAGLVSCATVTLTTAADGIQVEVVSGTWIDKVGGTDPHWFLPRPLLAVAAIGYYRRSEFLDRVFADIRDRIAGGRGPEPGKDDSSAAKA